ncbi:hypothetical protein ABT095_14745 [Kitasatospora sp. NPDC002227]|uniref:hypothetical protein n=1 Tax=Kitasatospora sp. NPDC002227 TaxID=3154773 RepID=UPI003329EAC2
MGRTRGQSIDQVQLRLQPLLREKLKAVVFDANAYGAARPNLDHLRRLAARLAGIGLETWLPQPVAWEWAEHLALDWRVLKNAASDERRRLQDAGIDIPMPFDDREQVIAAALENLAGIPHVRVIEMTGLSAIEGLKDQVLLREPAKLKGETAKTRGHKTGASDSAWIRDVLALADPDEILIISSDKDVKTAFRAWNKPEPTTRALHELLPTLFHLVVDDGSARIAILRYLLTQLERATADGGQLDLGRIDGLEASIVRDWDGDSPRPNTYGAAVTNILAVAGVENVTVEADEQDPEDRPSSRSHGPLHVGPADHHIAHATAYFLAEGERAVQTLLDEGDSESSVHPYGNVLVRVNLSFDFTDGVITSMEPEADGQAMLVDYTYDTTEEAEAAVAEALNVVPGFALDDYLDDTLAVEFPGAQAQAEISIRRDTEDWELTVTLMTGDDDDLDVIGELTAECRYNVDSWYGGSRDGFQGPDAFNVGVNGPDELSWHHGFWALPAWLVQRIDWSAYQPHAPKDEAEETDPS